MGRDPSRSVLSVVPLGGGRTEAALMKLHSGCFDVFNRSLGGLEFMLTPLHAKIYLGDDGATIGSSNFTESGLRLQMEANARFSASQERVRYAELEQIAENLWTMGRDYRDELIALLEQLLRLVSWQEALARACAELLEGEWAERYLRGDYLADAASLWPSQRQGIAQALYVLSH